MVDDRDVRTFARVTSAQLACPSCGEIWDLRSTRLPRGQTKLPRSIFDPLTARWQCGACGQVAVLGLVLYLVPGTDKAIDVPKDWRPTRAEAAQLRDWARGRVSTESWPQRKRRGANQIRKDTEP